MAVTIGIGTAITLTAAFTNGAGAAVPITTGLNWSASPTGIVTLAPVANEFNQMTATGLAAGTTTVTVQAPDYYSGTPPPPVNTTTASFAITVVSNLSTAGTITSS
jgi:hypothetical protein